MSAWTEPRRASDGSKQYRLRDRINNKKQTIIKNVGSWKAIAEAAKVNYIKAVGMGFTFKPPITVAEIEGFLQAKAQGRENDTSRRLPIEEMADLYLKLHGPSLKGGVSDDYRSPYNGLRYRMEQIKQGCWAGKYADEISKLNVRDFLSQFKTVGTRMRWISVLRHMFGFFEGLNEEGAPELGGPVRLPRFNPVSKWRKQMKPHEKLELPDKRVLSHQEWARLMQHASARIKPILEVALQRMLRLAEIRKITHASIVDGHIKGLQEKTGGEFSVPIIAGHSQKYDLTNFVREFRTAQERAGLLYPPEHPLHFSIKDLRRTGATWYYNKTKDLRRVQKMLGHKKLSMTERYLHISDVDLQEAADTMDALAAVKGN
jgi:integrase